MKIITAKKKPIEISAFQFDLNEAEKLINHKPHSKDKRGIIEINGISFRYNSFKTDFNASFNIPTLEGPLFVIDKDYIITGVNGEHYPCKPDIFKKTYNITI